MFLRFILYVSLSVKVSDLMKSGCSFRSLLIHTLLLSKYLTLIYTITSIAIMQNDGYNKAKEEHYLSMCPNPIFYPRSRHLRR